MKNFAFCVLLGLVFISVTHGAGISVRGPERTYHIALFDPAAECLVEELGDSGVLEASCTGNGFMVSATGEFGCTDSVGPTYCASKSRGDTVVGAHELTCENGKAYILSAGLGEVRCTHREGSLECISFDGTISAVASCDRGCGKVTGAGVCCFASSDSCPPGRNTAETQ